MHDFAAAVGGSILSFTRRELLDSAAEADVLHVPVDGGLLGTAYHVPSARHTRRAEAVLSRAKLVIVHGLYRYHAQWAVARARRSGIPYWIVPHGSLDPWVLSYRRLRKRAWLALIGDRALRDAAVVLLATRREQEKAAGHLQHARTAVVHWPVPRHSRDPAAGRRVRAALGIPTNVRVLLFLGRLHPMKRVLETIAAVAECGRSDLHLVVAGPGSPELDEAMCRQAAADAPGRIHVVGPVFGPDKSACFDAADGYVSLSIRENFGYTAAEAMAAGLPLILSPGNDLAHEPGVARCGWLLHDVTAAAQAIAEFAIAPPHVLSGMGDAARAWAEEQLTTERFAAAVRSLAAASLRERASA
ncbi:MAG TPA: glycosyltransferase [Longimicrobiales bacterium]|nr:glycosyltransferase [Longimicrobiales bacterium]